jgi:hypothetical protein
MGKDIETWEAASGALGVQPECALLKLSSMYQSIEFRIVYIQYFNDNFLWPSVIYGLVLGWLSAA